MNYLNLLQSISYSNKYYTWYFNICQRAMSRDVVLDYSEKHHIVPKSLGLGGEKDQSNLIRLTPREHYVAHMLLVRFLTKDAHKQKMKYAMWYLSTRNIQYKPSSRSYETARIHLITTIKSRVDSAETRRKKARPGQLNGMYGKTHSDSVKEKLGNLAKNRLTGKTYKDLYGAKKAQELKQDRSAKLKLYLKNHPESRKGKNNSNSKKYRITDSLGNVYTVVGGIKSFCQEHKLNVGAIIDVAKGRRAEYNGWSVCYFS